MPWRPTRSDKDKRENGANAFGHGVWSEKACHNSNSTMDQDTMEQEVGDEILIFF